jgi:predicted nucleic acid-binding protein
LKYLLDTDTCIHALKGVPSVLAALLSRSRPDVAVSAITEAHDRRVRLGECACLCAGTCEAGARGNSDRPLDTLIAAQAVSRKLVVFSNNVREFRRVAGLRVENRVS